jgi:hypothetical protein
MADLTTGMPNIFTMPSNGNNNDMGMGAITPLILGAALFGGKGGLFGNNNGDAAAAAAVAHGATVNEVQGIVNGINTIQDIGAVRREIADVNKEVWKAEGDLQTAITASTGSLANDVLQSQIASMQGQANIINAIDSHANDISSQVAANAALNSTQFAATAAASAAQFAVTNAAVASAASAAAVASKDAVIDGLRNTQIITATVVADGNVTRAAIADLKDSLPNARELDLQRQVGVLQGEVFKSQTLDGVRSGNIEVTTNVNQNNLQQQQQQQFQYQNGVLAQILAHSITQTATASNMNILGTQAGIAQTPVNVAR